MAMLGLEFQSQVVGPALVLGVAAAGLYGLLSVCLVLTYRVSRTIGFVVGGIAILATHLYWWLTFDTGVHGIALNPEPRMGRLAGLILVVAVGTAVGLLYGLSVTGSRLGQWPRLNLTVYSLAWLLGLVAIASTTVKPDGSRVPSIFGTRVYRVFNGVITIHQLVTLVILAAVIALLGFVFVHTQTGRNIRAVADDVEASQLVGVPLKRIGAVVYACSGALSAFAGVMVTSTVGVVVPETITVFLRALTVSVLGGFTSFSLALAGCLLLGVAESSLTAGVFGRVSLGSQEVTVMAALFIVVVLINRLRPLKVLEAESL